MGAFQMAGDEVSITFECTACGGKVLSLPDDPTDDSIATCKACGVEFGPYGAIKKRAMEMVKQEVSKRFQSAFKGLKGWTVK
jgi:hypothetical protein